MIGFLIYIIIYIKPDITFALDKLSQYIQNLYKYYKQTIKCLLKYIKSIIKYQIRFGPNKKLIIYLNANFANNKFNRKSIIATIGLINRESVFWASKK